MRRVGEDRGEQTAADIVEDAEDETGQYGPRRPYEITPVRADVGHAEQQGGDHQAELLLDGAPEKRFLTDTREDRDENEARRIGAVDQPRGELLGDLTQGGQESVSQEAQGDGAGCGGETEEHARGRTRAEKGHVEAPEATPQGRNDGERTVEQRGEGDETRTQRAPTPGTPRTGLHDGP